MAYVENLLGADETMLVKQRPHWIAFIAPVVNLIWSTLVLIVLIQLFDVSRPPWGLGALVEQYVPFRSIIAPLVSQLPSWLPPALILLYVVMMLWGFLSRELTLLNVIYVITSRRVIEIRGMLSKTVIDSSLEKINDVLLNQSLLGRMLGYGDLSIMTASEIGFNTMQFLPSPVEFKRTMLDAKRGLSEESRPAGARTTVAERLAQLEQLRQQGLISPAEFETRRQRLLDQI